MPNTKLNLTTVHILPLTLTRRTEMKCVLIRTWLWSPWDLLVLTTWGHSLAYIHSLAPNLNHHNEMPKPIPIFWTLHSPLNSQTALWKSEDETKCLIRSLLKLVLTHTYTVNAKTWCQSRQPHHPLLLDLWPDSRSHTHTHTHTHRLGDLAPTWWYLLTRAMQHLRLLSGRFQWKQ